MSRSRSASGTSGPGGPSSGPAGRSATGERRLPARGHRQRLAPHLPGQAGPDRGLRLLPVGGGLGAATIDGVRREGGASRPQPLTCDRARTRGSPRSRRTATSTGSATTRPDDRSRAAPATAGRVRPELDGAAGGSSDRAAHGPLRHTLPPRPHRVGRRQCRPATVCSARGSVVDGREPDPISLLAGRRAPAGDLRPRDDGLGADARADRARAREAGTGVAQGPARHTQRGRRDVRGGLRGLGLQRPVGRAGAVSSPVSRADGARRPRPDRAALPQPPRCGVLGSSARRPWRGRRARGTAAIPAANVVACRSRGGTCPASGGLPGTARA